jgi:hypothetical protein
MPDMRAPVLLFGCLAWSIANPAAAQQAPIAIAPEAIVWNGASADLPAGT